MRETVNRGSSFERAIGFSRCVRIGDVIAVSGTAPVDAEYLYEEKDAVFMQTKLCLEKILESLRSFGCDSSNVLRTRVFLTDVTRWEQAARAHREIFTEAGPACTFLEVSRFIDERWLVEIEADAIKPPASSR